MKGLTEGAVKLSNDDYYYFEISCVPLNIAVLSFVILLIFSGILQTKWEQVIYKKF